MIFKGFKGIGVITPSSGSTKTFRFTNADFSVDQGINTYTPAYGGSELIRIVSPKTSNINGSIGFMLTEDNAEYFYDLAYDAEEMSVELYYYDGVKRKFNNCVTNELAFVCKAGTFVNMNMDLLCKTYEQSVASKTYSTTEKLVDWTKTGIKKIFELNKKESFTYSIRNNLNAIKTATSLNVSYIERATQEISGEIAIYEARQPVFTTGANNKYSIQIPSDKIEFLIDDLSVSHYIANHWSVRTPLTPEVVITTLNWTRVDEMA